MDRVGPFTVGTPYTAWLSARLFRISGFSCILHPMSLYWFSTHATEVAHLNACNASLTILRRFPIQTIPIFCSRVCQSNTTFMKYFRRCSMLSQLLRQYEWNVCVVSAAETIVVTAGTLQNRHSPIKINCGRVVHPMCDYKIFTTSKKNCVFLWSFACCVHAPHATAIHFCYLIISYFICRINWSVWRWKLSVCEFWRGSDGKRQSKKEKKKTQHYRMRCVAFERNLLLSSKCCALTIATATALPLSIITAKFINIYLGFQYDTANRHHIVVSINECVWYWRLIFQNWMNRHVVFFFRFINIWFEIYSEYERVTCNTYIRFFSFPSHAYIVLNDCSRTLAIVFED